MDLTKHTYSIGRNNKLKMSILLIISFFFLWLIYREFKSDNDLNTFSKGYIAALLVFALLFALPIIKHKRFERFLSKHASTLADNKRAKVTCSTVFQSVYDVFGFSGVAYRGSGKIILQYPTCNDLRDYLDSPETATRKGIFSLHVFTHEAMHVRGELNERKTDCQAIQRNIRAAKLLGVDTHIAEQTAKDFYYDIYKKNSYSRSYFSKECSPGKSLDENLEDAFW